MWWAIPGSILTFTIMVVIPLIFEYKAGKKKEKEYAKELRRNFRDEK